MNTSYFNYLHRRFPVYIRRAVVGSLSILVFSIQLLPVANNP